MLLSFSHGFAFVHVYRTGGSSVEQALRPFAYDPAAASYLREPIRKLRVRRWMAYDYGHMHARELARVLPARTFDELFKFTFVRNPWDWHVSIYYKALQYPTHMDHQIAKSLGSFERYLDWHVHERGVDLQTHFFLADDGELLVDFVGRYESLARDFAAACARLGIDASLPHTNQTSHGDYRDYYTPATRKLVEDVYARDIDFLGYRFEPQDALPPVVRGGG